MARRNYEKKYPSVTTVLGILRKLGLEYWFKVNTLQYITEESEKGKEIGTQIHEVIEFHIKGEKAKIETQYPDEVTTALNSFLKFRSEMPDVVLEWSETPLASEVYQYNGTIDCIGKKGGVPVILDWKTANCKDKEFPEIYQEYLYQVSAYVFLYNENNPENIIDQAIIVSIAKDKVSYTARVLDKEEIKNHFEGAFLPALKIYNHQKLYK